MKPKEAMEPSIDHAKLTRKITDEECDHILKKFLKINTEDYIWYIEDTVEKQEIKEKFFTSLRSAILGKDSIRQLANTCEVASQENPFDKWKVSDFFEIYKYLEKQGAIK